jgi:replication factor C small subunit
MLDSRIYDPMSPTAVEDIVGNSELWRGLYEQIKDQTTGHLICVGPAGCGKSLFFRIALAGYKVLSIDCTANGGLRDMRDPIRTFTRGSKAAADLRWILLEHADALSSDAQAFLRRCLETTAGTTRVAFLCREAGAIPEPILSRTTLYTASSPDNTEMVYELMRRTSNVLDRSVAEDIVERTYGNLRAALTEALAVRHGLLPGSDSVLPALLAARPSASPRGSDTNESEWIAWAIRASTVCRNEGLDIRDVLRRGWPNHQIVSHACASWSRLGSVSPRALFYSCVKRILDSR